MRSSTAVIPITARTAPLAQPAASVHPAVELTAAKAPGQVIGIEDGDHRARVREQRDRLVMEHQQLVRPIAERVKASLPPSFELDDLMQTGLIALMHAAVRYRPDEHGGAPFSAYARKVVRGAILDSVSGRNWREATAQPLADPESEAGERPDFDERIDRERARQRIGEAARYLDERSRRIIAGYYREGATLERVGRRVGLSPSRTLEVKTEAIGRLRAMLCA